MPEVSPEKKYLSLKIIAEVNQRSLPELIERCRRESVDVLVLGDDWFVGDDAANLERLLQSPTGRLRSFVRPLVLIRLAAVAILLFVVQPSISQNISELWPNLLSGGRLTVTVINRSASALAEPNLSATVGATFSQTTGGLSNLWL
ncbi:MAG: hypothetical protein AAB505_02785, partial [Patescibacteria group bacterium]